MNCSYCVATSSINRKNDSSIDIEFALKGISDYFTDEDKHQIRFYSNGEPTCRMDIIKECHSYANSLIQQRKITNQSSNDLLSEIQTNCNFDEETACWLGENINYIWASIDGWPEIQKKYRPDIKNPSSATKIIRNVEQILRIKEEHKHDSFIGVRVTIVNETVSKQVELLKYFSDLGITEVCSEPCFLPVDSPSIKKKITLVDLRQYIINFVEAWHKAKEIGINYLNSFMVNFDEKVEYSCRTCLPTPHLTVDGFVSSCDLAFHGNTSMPELLFGKYNQKTKSIDYWQDAIENLRSRKCINISKCQNCSIKDYCGGGCLGRAFHETNDFYGVIDEYCWATRYLYNNIDLNDFRIKHLHP